MQRLSDVDSASIHSLSQLNAPYQENLKILFLLFLQKSEKSNKKKSKVFSSFPNAPHR